MFRRGVFTFLGVLLIAGSASAVDKCKAKVNKKDGTILVNAKGVDGSLHWGNDPGEVTNTFFNEGDCVAGGNAKKCTLGAPGTPDAILPPQLCRLYMEDDSTSCSTFIKGCTPGVRRSELSGINIQQAVSSCNGSGAQQGTNVYCSAGQVALGGGGYVENGDCGEPRAYPADVMLISSWPVGDPPDGWKVWAAEVDTHVRWRVRAYVVCVDAP